MALDAFIELIKSCRGEISNNQLAKRMKSAYDEVKKFLETIGIFEKEDKKNESYRSQIGRYKKLNPRAIKERPKIETMLLMKISLGCTLDQLAEIFYFEYYLCNQNLDESSQNQESNKVVQEPIIQLPEHISNSEELQSFINKYKKEGHKYVILRNEHTAVYTKNPNTLNSTKKITLLCFEDGITTLELFDYYRCIRTEDTVTIKYSDNISGVDRVKHPASDDNSVSINLKKPLKKNEVVEFFINYTYENVIDKDMDFHYTWTLWPTFELHLKVFPDAPEYIEMPKYREHRNKGCPIGIEEEIKGKTKEIFLKGERKYFEETVNPELRTTCGFYYEYKRIVK
jgi:hypothetical protein